MHKFSKKLINIYKMHLFCSVHPQAHVPRYANQPATPVCTQTIELNAPIITWHRALMHLFFLLSIWESFKIKRGLSENAKQCVRQMHCCNPTKFPKITMCLVNPSGLILQQPAASKYGRKFEFTFYSTPSDFYLLIKCLLSGTFTSVRILAPHNLT